MYTNNVKIEKKSPSLVKYVLYPLIIVSCLDAPHPRDQYLELSI